ncbi:hypothetical protein NLJ89_g9772 [Agrocybe chaxingu]|uniref:Fungal-type protein kinase domain-containing protein n=1 Tax=Agrocybe chaxingu TaxID=84603 RepID=A0A9W8MT81_9AGAR|nr:hypothetical protein NLJ89_g9772 [Agrocybe chaxingu]
MQNRCESRRNRLPRPIVVQELEPFGTALSGKDFVEAWSDTVQRHRVLHRQGIDTGDPRLWNILYDRTKRSTILTDFDLRDTPDFLPSYSYAGRTGAIPFMAIELLSEKHENAAFRRTYRHELEAFVWVLLFVLRRYNDKTLVEDIGNTCIWFTPEYRECFIYKWAITSKPTLLAVQESFKAQSWLVKSLLLWVYKMFDERQRESRAWERKGQPVPELLEEEEEQLIEDLLAIVEEQTDRDQDDE